MRGYIVKRSVPSLVFTGLLALGAVSTAQAEIKIGVVDTQRLMNDAPQAKSAIDQIRTEFAPRERELQTLGASLKAREEKLAKDQAVMTEAQRTSAEKELRDGYRDAQKLQAEIQDDLNARRNEELSKLNRVLIEEVNVFAKAQGFDLILTDGVIYRTNALDVTGAILTAMQSRRPAAGSAPAPAPRPAAPATKP
jgi:outer membrane protein